jgi:BirA family biotin operon repressor/biotin-[acetyl-CoA-carboxylase] ligase
VNKSADLARSKLIKVLADGEFHSGAALGQYLGLSRTAISNHVKVLCSLGLDVYRVTGKGYKLAQAITLLNANEIKHKVPVTENYAIEVLNVVGSTNQYIKDHRDTLANGHVCIAEAQTEGRGRHGRKWVSPYGASLYLSMFWSFAGGYAALGGLSLAIGVAIANTLQQLGIADVKVKWPNDIYAQGKKLAGILIEVEGQIGSGCDSVIGIGLNVALPKNVTGIDQPWTDLTQLSQEGVDRNYLTGLLLAQLHKTLYTFEEKGIQAFIEKWRTLDLYADQPIKLMIGKETIMGVSRGIDETGALLLESLQGVKAYHGGEISVRPG